MLAFPYTYYQPETPFLEVTPNPTTCDPAHITAMLWDNSGNPYAEQGITFTTTGGKFLPAGTTSVGPITTGPAGIAKATLEAGNIGITGREATYTVTASFGANSSSAPITFTSALCGFSIAFKSGDINTPVVARAGTLNFEAGGNGVLQGTVVGPVAKDPWLSRVSVSIGGLTQRAASGIRASVESTIEGDALLTNTPEVNVTEPNASAGSWAGFAFVGPVLSLAATAEVEQMRSALAEQGTFYTEVTIPYSSHAVPNGRNVDHDYYFELPP